MVGSICSSGEHGRPDSNPTKLIEIGKQLQIKRSALTTFSIANHVATYFAILPRTLPAPTPRRATAKAPCTLSTS